MGLDELSTALATAFGDLTQVRSLDGAPVRTTVENLPPLAPTVEKVVTLSDVQTRMYTSTTMRVRDPATGAMQTVPVPPLTPRQLFERTVGAQCRVLRRHMEQRAAARAELRDAPPLVEVVLFFADHARLERMPLPLPTEAARLAPGIQPTTLHALKREERKLRAEAEEKASAAAHLPQVLAYPCNTRITDEGVWLPSDRDAPSMQTVDMRRLRASRAVPRGGDFAALARNADDYDGAFNAWEAWLAYCEERILALEWPPRVHVVASLLPGHIERFGDTWRFLPLARLPNVVDQIMVLYGDRMRGVRWTGTLDDETDIFLRRVQHDAEADKAILRAALECHEAMTPAQRERTHFHFVTPDADLFVEGAAVLWHATSPLLWFSAAHGTEFDTSNVLRLDTMFRHLEAAGWTKELLAAIAVGNGGDFFKHNRLMANIGAPKVWAMAHACVPLFGRRRELPSRSAFEELLCVIYARACGVATPLRAATAEEIEAAWLAGAPPRKPRAKKGAAAEGSGGAGAAAPDSAAASAPPTDLPERRRPQSVLDDLNATWRDFLLVYYYMTDPMREGLVVDSDDDDG